MSDFPISELRQVVLYFRGAKPGRETIDWMHESQVETYIKAKVELHYEPGINPHVQELIDSGRESDPSFLHANRSAKTSPVWHIDVRRFFIMSSAACWHTTSGLGFHMTEQEIQEKGAKVLHYDTIRIWTHPELQRMEREEEELA